MSDSNTPETAGIAIDPVAAARIAMAAQEAGGTEVQRLAKQVKALWITVGVTLVLVVVLVIFTLLPRFGIQTMGGRDFQGRPGGFVPGQGQGQGMGQGQGQGMGQGQGIQQPDDGQ
jgi:hypothetical protein